MNNPKKLVLSRAACVAAVIIAGLLGGVVGGNVVAHHQKIINTTTFASPLREQAPADPLMNPTLNNWSSGYGIRLPKDPEFADESIDGSLVNTGQEVVLPVYDSLAISLLQSDGGAVHCKAGGNITSTLVSTSKVVTAGDNPIDVQINPDRLTLSPLYSDIEPGRVVVVMNNTRAAWLPATAVGNKLVLRGVDWKSDVTMESHLEICTLG